MLMEAQRELGWEVIDGGGGGNFLRTALNVWHPDILHVHWLHPYLLRQSRGGSLLRGFRFLAEIAWIQRCGARIVWTVHNLCNHDKRFPSIELQLTRRFARLCDLVITHGVRASKLVRERFRIPARIPVREVRFPNYCRHYPAECSTSQARSAWGLGPDELVIGFLGRVEPYKQVCELVRAFRSSAGDDVRLLLGGLASSPEYAKQVEEGIGRDSRIMFRNEFIPETKVASFLQATDVVACPSIGILTSSSVPLAMSFARTVVAPAEGCIPEQVGETGFLYDNRDPEGLRLALQIAIARRAQLPNLGQAAFARVGQSSPRNIATAINALYDALLANPM